MSEDVRPICIFCHARFTKAGLGIDAVVPCPDPRTQWGHVEFWRSTKEQRDARFGTAVTWLPPNMLPGTVPPSVMDDRPPPAPEAAPAPQMGFGL